MQPHGLGVTFTPICLFIYSCIDIQTLSSQKNVLLIHSYGKNVRTERTEARGEITSVLM